MRMQCGHIEALKASVIQVIKEIEVFYKYIEYAKRHMHDLYNYNDINNKFFFNVGCISD